MKKAYRKLLKAILHKNISTTREQLKYTQSEMADKLLLDLRSYVDIDHGESLCGTLSFVLYLLYCCPDVDKLLEEIRQGFENLKNTSSQS